METFALVGILLSLATEVGKRIENITYPKIFLALLAGIAVIVPILVSGQEINVLQATEEILLIVGSGVAFYEIIGRKLKELFESAIKLFTKNK